MMIQPKLLFLPLLFIHTATAVTVIPSELNLPRVYDGPGPVKSERDLLFLGAPGTSAAKNPSITKILSSSHRGLDASHGIHSSSDSFVRGALDAWAVHQHFVIRPEDVWFTILVQLNFYMSKHGDDKEVRDKFVNFQGKQNITIMKMEIDDILREFQYAIQGRVKTEWLLDWIQPRFSTSNERDNMMGNIFMMGLMKSYFAYYGRTPVCGIPSITLLGKQQDWERLLAKLDRLPEFGPEPTTYSNYLRPILKRFVKTFQTPEDPEIRQFWSNIVSGSRTPPSGCTGPTYYITGWITGFHFWKADGSSLPGLGLRESSSRDKRFTLDDVTYPPRSTANLPFGYATVPIKLDLEWNRFYTDAELLVGMMGKNITKGKPEGYDEAMRKVNFKLPSSVASSQHGTLQPVPTWFLYVQDEKNTKNLAEVGHEKEYVEGMLSKTFQGGVCEVPA
jgi:hypothetical protein